VELNEELQDVVRSTVLLIF